MRPRRIVAHLVMRTLGLLLFTSCTPVIEGDAAVLDGALACVRAADCDDGLFCNGLEVCAPDDPASDGRGCLAGAPPCVRDDCSEEGAGCASCEPADADGDGRDALACGGDDCDDADAHRRPELPEICDEDDRDEDCDPRTVGSTDLDGDGEVSALCCNEGTCGPDCDDTRADIGTFGVERCNGLDDDCDALADDGLSVPLFADVDGDGFGQTGDVRELCAPTERYRAVLGGDCDDNRARVNPEGVEICNGLDDDCDAFIDGAASCAVPGAEAVCEGGACRIVACEADFADCDGVPTNGCERSLRTILDCGGCGIACSAPLGGVAGCIDGRCEVTECSSSRLYCDGRCVYPSAEHCGPSCAPCIRPPSHGRSSCHYTGRCFVSCDGGYIERQVDGVPHCLWYSTELGAVEVVGSLVEPPMSGTNSLYATHVPSTTTTARLRYFVGDVADLSVTLRTDEGATSVMERGVPSAPLPLRPGENVFYFDVRSAAGEMRTYEVRVTRADQTWEVLEAPAPTANERWGSAIAMDGDTLIVGSSSSREGGSPDGAAHVFRHDASGWHLEATLRSSTPSEWASFGASVALDGDTAVVGEPNAGAGSVHVFSRVGDVWSLSQVLTASNPDLGDDFGSSVALSGDTLAVGAPGEDSRALGIDGDGSDDSRLDSGAAYVFARTLGVWSQEAYVKAINTRPGSEFGAALAVDGETLAIGAPMDDGLAADPFGFGPENGAVYLLERSGTWSHRAYLKGPSVLFGRALALEGTRLAVGSSERASVFRRDGSGWSTAQVVSGTSGFGFAVALSGGQLLVGAPQDTSAGAGVGAAPGIGGSGGTSGAAYLFVERGGVWTRLLYVKPPLTRWSEGMGTSVALTGTPLSGGTLLMAAPEYDGSASDSGAVYMVTP